jgi:hypothetical protein
MSHCSLLRAARLEWPTGVSPFLLLQGDMPVTFVIAFMSTTSTSCWPWCLSSVWTAYNLHSPWDWSCTAVSQLPPPSGRQVLAGPGVLSCLFSGVAEPCDYPLWTLSWGLKLGWLSFGAGCMIQPYLPTVLVVGRVFSLSLASFRCWLA